MRRENVFLTNNYRGFSVLNIEIKPDGTVAINANHRDVTVAAQPLSGATQSLEWSDTLCNGKSVDYDAAEKACAALGEGWRLPTRMELESILDLTRHDLAIDTKRFPDTKSTWYWTSTPCAWAPGAAAWIVDFNSGLANSLNRGNRACVRAVRSVPAGQ